MSTFWRKPRQLKTAAAGLLLAVAVPLIFSPTAAADITISVTPSLLEFAVDPGARFEEIITVTNEGTDRAVVRVNVSAPEDASSELSAERYIQVDSPEFALSSRQKKEVRVSVTIPEDAAPGGLYATIFIQTSPSRIGSGGDSSFAGGSGFGARIGAKFITTVRGPGLTLDGGLAKLVPVAAGPGRIGFRIEIENTGNVHLVPKGEIEVQDEDGNVVGDFTLPETPAILPGVTKSFRLRGAVDVPAGTYQASGKIDYGWTQQQGEAARVDADDWQQRESSKEIKFSSVPKLKVTSLKMEAGGGSEVKFTVVLENDGDLEVSPAGVIDVHDDSGERFIALNIGAGNLVVQPLGTNTSEHVYTGSLRRGKYNVRASFNYHGDENAEGTAETVIEADVILPIVPKVAEFRGIDTSPANNDISLLLLAVYVLIGGILGIVAVLGLLAVGWRVLGFDKR